MIEPTRPRIAIVGGNSLSTDITAKLAELADHDAVDIIILDEPSQDHGADTVITMLDRDILGTSMDQPLEIKHRESIPLRPFHAEFPPLFNNRAGQRAGGSGRDGKSVRRMLKTRI